MTGVFDVAADGVVLRLTVQPGAGGDEVVGRHGDSVRVRVSAPPVSGRANEALVALLATVLGVDRRALRVTAGHRSRRKRVRVTGLAPADVERRLAPWLGTS